ncbi:MAG: transporter, partial [Caulobacteraceae bacterium]|nr:transporter [Caulobacteraceae bacterium]
FAMAYGPAYAVLQGLVTPTMRVTAMAIMLFIINLIGLGLGPLTMGLLSDTFAQSLGEAHGLRLALILFSLLGFPIAMFFWMARKSLVRDTVS